MAKKKFRDFEIPLVAFLPQGPDAEPLYNALRRGQLDLGFCDYHSETKELRGSSHLIAGRLNDLLSDSGLRVAVPSDFGLVMNLIQDKFYSDFNALDVREATPSDEGNLGIWRQANELAEKEQGKVQYPFRIQGFSLQPDEGESGYKVRIIPANNFEVIQDNRLNLSSGTRFNSVDETGMINPAKNGKFIWRAGNNGVSGVFLYSSGSLRSGGGGLAGSGGDGRVVFVTAEGSPQNFLRQKLRSLKRMREAKVAAVDSWYDNALKEAPSLK